MGSKQELWRPYLWASWELGGIPSGKDLAKAFTGELSLCFKGHILPSRRHHRVAVGSLDHLHRRAHCGQRHVRKSPSLA